jgi:hypothetical protein
MIRAILALVLAVLPAFAQPAAPITEAELVRRTQALYDAVAPGDKGPWQRFYADDGLFFDEKGRSMDKAALVADVAPLPKGYGGTIRIVHPKSRIFKQVAILSYDADETETVFGQRLSACYHTTDTWMLRNGQWRIVASQSLRYYEDPALGQVDATRLKAFIGTYELSPENRRTVTVDRGALYLQRGSGPLVQLLPEDAGIFFRKGVEGRILFRVDGAGKVDALVDRRNNEDIVWKRVE